LNTERGAAVRVQALVKRYSSGNTVIQAVDGVDLDLPAGASMALVGPSGSGKSTLLHLLGGMDRPDSGQILVGDCDVTKARGRQLVAHRRSVGFVFQRFHLLPALSALDNVLAPVLPYRTSFDKKERAKALLDAVGLAGREKSLPHKLSGGQQQRVAIARALIAEPSLILADEPTGNLDSTTGEAIVQLLFDLRRNSGTTLVIATHDIALAAQCDVVVRIRDGKRIDSTPVTRPDVDDVLERIARLR